MGQSDVRDRRVAKPLRVGLRVTSAASARLTDGASPLTTEYIIVDTAIR